MIIIIHFNPVRSMIEWERRKMGQMAADGTHLQTQRHAGAEVSPSPLAKGIR